MNLDSCHNNNKAAINSYRYDTNVGGYTDNKIQKKRVEFVTTPSLERFNIEQNLPTSPKATNPYGERNLDIERSLLKRVPHPRIFTSENLLSVAYNVYDNVSVSICPQTKTWRFFDSDHTEVAQDQGNSVTRMTEVPVGSRGVLGGPGEPLASIARPRRRPKIQLNWDNLLYSGKRPDSQEPISSDIRGSNKPSQAVNARNFPATKIREQSVDKFSASIIQNPTFPNSQKQATPIIVNANHYGMKFPIEWCNHSPYRNIPGYPTPIAQHSLSTRIEIEKSRAPGPNQSSTQNADLYRSTIVGLPEQARNLNSSEKARNLNSSLQIKRDLVITGIETHRGTYSTDANESKDLKHRVSHERNLLHSTGSSYKSLHTDIEPNEDHSCYCCPPGVFQVNPVEAEGGDCYDADPNIATEKKHSHCSILTAAIPVTVCNSDSVSKLQVEVQRESDNHQQEANERAVLGKRQDPVGEDIRSSDCQGHNLKSKEEQWDQGHALNIGSKSVLNFSPDYRCHASLEMIDSERHPLSPEPGISLKEDGSNDSSKAHFSNAGYVGGFIRSSPARCSIQLPSMRRKEPFVPDPNHFSRRSFRSNDHSPLQQPPPQQTSSTLPNLKPTRVPLATRHSAPSTSTLGNSPACSRTFEQSLRSSTVPSPVGNTSSSKRQQIPHSLSVPSSPSFDRRFQSLPKSSLSLTSSLVPIQQSLPLQAPAAARTLHRTVSQTGNRGPEEQRQVVPPSIDLRTPRRCVSQNDYCAEPIRTNEHRTSGHKISISRPVTPDSPNRSDAIQRPRSALAVHTGSSPAGPRMCIFIF